MRFLGLLQCWISGESPDQERRQAFGDDCGHLPCNIRRKCEEKIRRKDAATNPEPRSERNRSSQARSWSTQGADQGKYILCCYITTPQVGETSKGEMTKFDRFRKCGIYAVYNHKPLGLAQMRAYFRNMSHFGLLHVHCVFLTPFCCRWSRNRSSLVGVAIRCLHRMPRDLCQCMQYCFTEI